MRLDDADHGAGPAPAPPGPAFRLVERVARACAVAGGLVLLGMALMTCVSVLTRLFAGRPIFGIFELVELFTGIAVLSFFPYTHVTRGNVVAEFFTQKLPPRLRALLELVADAGFLGIAAFAFWRVAAGLEESLGSLNRSFVLNLPEWVFYGPATLWLALLVVVSVAVLLRTAGRVLG
jgi:TRAP-type C4-dicarboxylate transport system permease small subunit